VASAFGSLVYVDQPTELYRQHDANVLGARTLSKRVKRWVRPNLLLEKYWNLIQDSQAQAKKLLDFPDLAPKDREMVQAFTTIMQQDFKTRNRWLKHYNLKKNKAFHTFVFRTLIRTKLAFPGEKE
jgi:rhamnosyltransferase